MVTDRENIWPGFYDQLFLDQQNWVVSFWGPRNHRVGRKRGIFLFRRLLYVALWQIGFRISWWNTNRSQRGAEAASHVSIFPRLLTHFHLPKSVSTFRQQLKCQEICRADATTVKQKIFSTIPFKYLILGLDCETVKASSKLLVFVGGPTPKLVWE